MTEPAHDVGAAALRSDHRGAGRAAGGIGFAVLSAVSFGLSGPVAAGLLDAGWDAAAAVLVRVAVGAVVVLPVGVMALRGRWGLVARSAPVVLAYGLLAVAGAQFCFFAAVSRMQVGPALMIEYTAPAVVVAWLWLRHGQRPGGLTLLGAALAAGGLVLVLDLVSGGSVDPVGVLWALGAMVGLASYFVISADERNGLPPIVLAAGGLVVGALVLAVAGLVGLLPMHAATKPATYAGHDVSWWVPLTVLGLVTAALSYTTGIAAGRRLGSRLASFVALLEVVAAVGFAWLLLGQLPDVAQLVGGVLILAGVVAVRLGERTVVRRGPTPG